MKKIERKNLVIKKEMVSFLSENDLNLVKGGANTRVEECNTFHSNCICYSNHVCITNEPHCDTLERTGNQFSCACKPITTPMPLSNNCDTDTCIITKLCPKTYICQVGSL